MDLCSASVNPLTKQISVVFSELFGLTDKIVTKRRRTHNEEQYKKMFIRIDTTNRTG